MDRNLFSFLSHDWSNRPKQRLAVAITLDGDQFMTEKKIGQEHTFGNTPYIILLILLH